MVTEQMTRFRIRIYINGAEQWSTVRPAQTAAMVIGYCYYALANVVALFAEEHYGAVDEVHITCEAEAS